MIRARGFASTVAFLLPNPKLFITQMCIINFSFIFKLWFRPLTLFQVSFIISPTKKKKKNKNRNCSRFYLSNLNCFILFLLLPIEFTLSTSLIVGFEFDLCFYPHLNLSNLRWLFSFLALLCTPCCCLPVIVFPP